jgi:hypothetical protein
VLRIAQTQDANDPPNPHRNPPAGRRIPARREHLDARSPEPGQAGAATPWESRTLTPSSDHAHATIDSMSSVSDRRAASRADRANPAMECLLLHPRRLSLWSHTVADGGTVRWAARPY